MESFDWFSNTVEMDLQQKVNLFQELMEKAINKVFVKKSEKLSKRMILSNVRGLLTRKNKLSKAIAKTQCRTRITSLRSEFIEVEDSLCESYERFHYRKEMEVISNLKEKPGVFY